jgi:hypothetical protein
VHDQITLISRANVEEGGGGGGGMDDDDDDDAMNAGGQRVKPAGVPIPAGVYLDSLCPITSEQLCGGGGGGGGGVEGGFGGGDGNGGAVKVESS